MATSTASARPLTANQSSYLRSLVAKISNQAVQDALRADLNTLLANRLLTVGEASRQIDRVKAVVAAQAVAQAAPAPVVAPAPVLPFPVVRPGRYAVEDAAGIRFYNVTAERGRTDVKRYVSDALVKITTGEAVKNLRQIEADPQAAVLLFAEKTERCYVCGRRLTDDEEGGSMEQGIGPVCAAKGLGF